MGDVMSRDEDGRKTPEECLVRGELTPGWNGNWQLLQWES